MMNKVVEINVNDLTPYRNNARIHTEKQVHEIAESISKYGFNDFVGVWGDKNIIVEGHGRVEAARLLGLKKVPCIRLDHLSDVERKEYTIAHNRTAELSEWDFSTLEKELDSINAECSLDNSIFDGLLEEIDTKNLQHSENKVNTQYAKSNILNLEKRQFNGVGKYDIPEIMPVHADEIGVINEWIGFNYVMTDKNPQGKAVHFFIDDYQFERVFNQPEKYVEKLRQYVAVLAPDFSPYGDMPLATQLYNHYRKHWVAAYWQECGIKVIPTIRASTDERSLEWYLDGEPENSVVCISSMYTHDENARNYYINEHNNMVQKLNPEKIFVYGKIIDGTVGNIERIPTFSERRFRHG